MFDSWRARVDSWAASRGADLAVGFVPDDSMEVYTFCQSRDRVLPLSDRLIAERTRDTRAWESLYSAARLPGPRRVLVG